MCRDKSNKVLDFHFSWLYRRIHSEGLLFLLMYRCRFLCPSVFLQWWKKVLGHPTHLKFGNLLISRCTFTHTQLDWCVPFDTVTAFTYIFFLSQ